MPPSPGLTFAAAKALTSLDHIQALQRVLALQVTSGPRSVRFKLSLALSGLARVRGLSATVVVAGQRLRAAAGRRGVGMDVHRDEF